jgi:uncharacterized protein
MSQDLEVPVVIQNDLHPPMLGVLHQPAVGVPPSGIGVLIVNGGAQYRAGAHRLFVRLARHLVAQGHAVLRFDFPGQGDSPGEPVPFDDTAPLLGAAINTLHSHLPRLTQTTLCGLCDGASGSLLYLDAFQDPRITRLLLINPWIVGAQAQAKAQVKHYYRQRLLMPDFWRKLLRGGVAWTAVRGLIDQMQQAWRTPTVAEPDTSFRMARAWTGFPGSIALLLSDEDRTAQAFWEELRGSTSWNGCELHKGLQVLRVPGADHTLSTPTAQETLFRFASQQTAA